ncbi:MAG: hypothetical protein C5S49_03740 [Candidatus Methanogaster sp.]|nr:MAG: hypothetical protein C5S49_03740 [ANME-2 cluster archaeon]
MYLPEANFVPVNVSPHQPDAVRGFLRGIARRFMTRGDSLVGVGVGTAEQNYRVVEAFSEFLEG